MTATGHLSRFNERFIQLFWSRVNKTDECWEWTRGGTVKGSNTGYGRVSYQNKMHLAHRVAYELTFGLIPEGVLVLHRCDNPPCCNPDHLFLGDHSANMQDMLQKERGVFQRHPEKLKAGKDHWTRARPDKVLKGEAHPQCKLTAEQVKRIFADKAAGLSDRKIAALYGVHERTIGRILKGQNWRRTLMNQEWQSSNKCACGHPLTNLSTNHSVCANPEWPHVWAGDVGIEGDGKRLGLALLSAETENRKLLAERDRLQRWRRLLLECPKGEVRQTGLERFAMGDGIQPIIQAWRDKVAEVEAERDALRLTISTELAPMVAAAQAEARELQASSDLRWNADQRARERWKAAHPDQPQTWPDHADLCVWLMAELETAPTAAERGKGDL